MRLHRWSRHKCSPVRQVPLQSCPQRNQRKATKKSCLALLSAASHGKSSIDSEMASYRTERALGLMSAKTHYRGGKFMKLKTEDWLFLRGVICAQGQQVCLQKGFFYWANFKQEGPSLSLGHEKRNIRLIEMV